MFYIKICTDRKNFLVQLKTVVVTDFRESVVFCLATIMHLDHMVELADLCSPIEMTDVQ